MDSSANERFAAALGEVFDDLDWERLGHLYCEEGGEHFFPLEQRDAIADAGLRLAGDVAEALGASADTGRSLYVGAAVGELAPMLCEAIVLGREVVAVNLENEETEELNRALRAASKGIGHDLPRIRTGEWDPLDIGRCDHVWLVSVLTDPDAFPALHDELYARSGTDLATQRGYLPDELAAARHLVRQALDCSGPGRLFTTTDEELPVVAEQCARRDWALEVPDAARLSAIVGDPVRTCRVVPAEPDGGSVSAT